MIMKHHDVQITGQTVTPQGRVHGTIPTRKEKGTRKCSGCGSPMVSAYSNTTGEFLCCWNYPQCPTTRSLETVRSASRGGQPDRRARRAGRDLDNIGWFDEDGVPGVDFPEEGELTDRDW